MTKKRLLNTIYTLLLIVLLTGCYKYKGTWEKNLIGTLNDYKNKSIPEEEIHKVFTKAPKAILIEDDFSGCFVIDEECLDYKVMNKAENPIQVQADGKKFVIKLQEEDKYFSGRLISSKVWVNYQISEN